MGLRGLISPFEGTEKAKRLQENDGILYGKVVAFLKANKHLAEQHYDQFTQADRERALAITQYMGGAGDTLEFTYQTALINSVAAARTKQASYTYETKWYNGRGKGMTVMLSVLPLVTVPFLIFSAVFSPWFLLITPALMLIGFATLLIARAVNHSKDKAALTQRLDEIECERTVALNECVKKHKASQSHLIEVLHAAFDAYEPEVQPDRSLQEEPSCRYRFLSAAGAVNPESTPMLAQMAL